MRCCLLHRRFWRAAVGACKVFISTHSCDGDTKTGLAGRPVVIMSTTPCLQLAAHHVHQDMPDSGNAAIRSGLSAMGRILRQRSSSCLDLRWLLPAQPAYKPHRAQA